jgi:hypothetical protein
LKMENAIYHFANLALDSFFQGWQSLDAPLLLGLQHLHRDFSIHPCKWVYLFSKRNDHKIGNAEAPTIERKIIKQNEPLPITTSILI